MQFTVDSGDSYHYLLHKQRIWTLYEEFHTMHPKTLLALATVMAVLSLVAIQYNFFIDTGNNPFTQTGIVNTSSYYPDGPVWKNKALYYSEYSKDRVMVRDGRGNIELWNETGCGPRSIAFFSDNLIIACRDADSLVEITTAGRVVRRITADRSGHPLEGPIDFATDTHGGLYFATAGPENSGRMYAGRIYYMAADGVINTTGISIQRSGGMVIIPEKKIILVSEKTENRVIQFDLVQPGVLSNRREFIRLSDITAAPDGMDTNAGPDGLAVDSAGNIFVCHPGASRILVLDQSGVLLQVIKTPLPYVTGIAFGRFDNVIYITAVSSLSDPPFSGVVFEYTRKRTRQTAR
ncbi:MAG TPA: SMP-30/gluconolactonase/LRE family protein [Spirochaetota bacterium]|nr:SMP-30/gluconolactonase/LRE family protein [Spirochaetota bacterium]